MPQPNPRRYLAGTALGTRRAMTLRQTPQETARRIVLAIQAREAEGRAWAIDDYTQRPETQAAVWTLLGEVRHGD